MRRWEGACGRQAGSSVYLVVLAAQRRQGLAHSTRACRALVKRRRHNGSPIATVASLLHLGLYCIQEPRLQACHSADATHRAAQDLEELLIDAWWHHNHLLLNDVRREAGGCALGAANVVEHLAHVTGDKGCANDNVLAAGQAF